MLTQFTVEGFLAARAARKVGRETEKRRRSVAWMAVSWRDSRAGAARVEPARARVRAVNFIVSDLGGVEMEVYIESKGRSRMEEEDGDGLPGFQVWGELLVFDP